MQRSSGWPVRPEERNGITQEPSVGILLSEVASQNVEWLWTGRILKGKLTVVEGDPGTGKSAMVMDLAARVSSGLAMPDESEMGTAAGVVILSAEDGLADTVRPRLDAAGGDPSRVLALTTKEDGEAGERLLTLPDDILLIERGVAQVGAGLVTIDPLVAFFGTKTDSHRDQDVRRALAALAALADRTGAAVVVVRHLNKTVGGNALYRGGGSIGIIAAARSGLLVAKDAEDENRRVLAVQKGNLSKPAPSLAFSLEEVDNGAVRLAWHGDSPLDAAQLLGGNYARNDHTEVGKAEVFLLEILKDGPLLKNKVQEMAEEVGIAERTLERAKKRLGVVSKKRGDGWAWSLRNSVDNDRQPGDGQPEDRGSLAHPMPYESDLPYRGEQHCQGRQDRHGDVDGGLGGLANPERGRLANPERGRLANPERGRLANPERGREQYVL